MANFCNTLQFKKINNEYLLNYTSKWVNCMVCELISIKLLKIMSTLKNA